jgi:hypothetical protein
VGISGASRHAHGWAPGAWGRAPGSGTRLLVWAFGIRRNDEQRLARPAEEGFLRRARVLRLSGLSGLEHGSKRHEAASAAGAGFGGAGGVVVAGLGGGFLGDELASALSAVARRGLFDGRDDHGKGAVRTLGVQW